MYLRHRNSILPSLSLVLKTHKKCCGNLRQMVLVVKFLFCVLCWESLPRYLVLLEFNFDHLLLVPSSTLRKKTCNQVLSVSPSEFLSVFVIGDRVVECEQSINSSRGRYEEWTPRWSEVIPDIDATSQHHNTNIPPATNLGIETSEPQM